MFKSEMRINKECVEYHCEFEPKTTEILTKVNKDFVKATVIDPEIDGSTDVTPPPVVATVIDPEIDGSTDVTPPPTESMPLGSENQPEGNNKYTRTWDYLRNELVMRGLLLALAGLVRYVISLFDDKTR